MQKIAALAGDDSKRKKKQDDDFGMDDADWLVYRDIAATGDEDEEALLAECEGLLAKYDPECHLVDAPLLGPFFGSDAGSSGYQLRLGIERLRVPEILFQPELVGVDQAGLEELLQPIPHVLLTGGCASIPGLTPRIHAILQSLLPPNTSISIVKSEEPSLDAWRGAATLNWNVDAISYQSYAENGVDRF